MTIVDLADLDTFIRDSLFEVRRGIANSRNATQANPLLGVMVDLPEKIDFEIMVTSAHQSLTRNVVSSDSDNSSETTSESQKSVNTSLEIGGAKGLSSNSNTTKSSDISLEVQQDKSNEDVLDIQASQEGSNTTGKGASLESSSESEQRSQGRGESQNETRDSQSKQLELHKEANDRASSTFDEDEGTWGGQGQISTPTLPGGKACTCS